MAGEGFPSPKHKRVAAMRHSAKFPALALFSWTDTCMNRDGNPWFPCGYQQTVGQAELPHRPAPARPPPNPTGTSQPVPSNHAAISLAWGWSWCVAVLLIPDFKVMLQMRITAQGWDHTPILHVRHCQNPWSHCCSRQQCSGAAEATATATKAVRYICLPC